MRSVNKRDESSKKAPPIAEEILRLRKEIITTGIDQFRSSNIEKIKKLNELIERANQ